MWLVLLGFNFLSHFCSFSMLLLRFTGGCCTACEIAPSPCTRLEALVRCSHITAKCDFAAVTFGTSVVDTCIGTLHTCLRMSVGLATCRSKLPRTWQQHCMSCISMTSWILFMQTKAVKQHNLATIMHRCNPRQCLLSLHDSSMMQHCLSACSMRASCKSNMMPAAEHEHEHEHTW